MNPHNYSLNGVYNTDVYIRAHCEFILDFSFYDLPINKTSNVTHLKCKVHQISSVLFITFLNKQCVEDVMVVGTS